MANEMLSNIKSLCYRSGVNIQEVRSFLDGKVVIVYSDGKRKTYKHTTFERKVG